MEVIDRIKASIRNIPDFPIPGIQFKDITTLLKDRQMVNETLGLIYNYYKDKKITKVVAVESRGFIFGGMLAERLNAGFVPVRKPGKLPSQTIKKEYTLEYGTNTIEIHTDALDATDTVLFHDDLLATGGTAKAAIELIESMGVTKIYINFLIELDFLHGREFIGNQYDIHSLIHY